MHDPKAEYWRSNTSQQELLSKPPHEAVFIDGAGQVVAYFQQLRPVPDAYRRYLPDASRVDRLPWTKTGRHGAPAPALALGIAGSPRPGVPSSLGPRL